MIPPPLRAAKTRGLRHSAGHGKKSDSRFKRGSATPCRTNFKQRRATVNRVAGERIANRPTCEGHFGLLPGRVGGGRCYQSVPARIRLRSSFRWGILSAVYTRLKRPWLSTRRSASVWVTPCWEFGRAHV